MSSLLNQVRDKRLRSLQGRVKAALMFSLDGGGSHMPIAFSQFADEQLQRHVVTDPSHSRIVTGALVAKKGMRGIELMPLEVPAGIAQRAVN